MLRMTVQNYKKSTFSVYSCGKNLAERRKSITFAAAITS